MSLSHGARAQTMPEAQSCLLRFGGNACLYGAVTYVCYPFEGHDIPFRYSAHCAGARRHDWHRRAADAARARRRGHRVERKFTALPYVGFWR